MAYVSDHLIKKLETILSNHHLDIVRQAVSHYVRMKAMPPPERTGSEPWELDVALCCVTLGDVFALERWVGRLEDALKGDSSAEKQEIASALRQLLSEWQAFEVHAGTGALLDYAHCLESSPASVVGVDRIANARILQTAKVRVPGDPYWALDYQTI